MSTTLPQLRLSGKFLAFSFVYSVWFFDRNCMVWFYLGDWLALWFTEFSWWTSGVPLFWHFHSLPDQTMLQWLVYSTISKPYFWSYKILGSAFVIIFSWPWRNVVQTLGHTMSFRAHLMFHQFNVENFDLLSSLSMGNVIVHDDILFFASLKKSLFNSLYI